jgi:uncharacterized protein YacL
MNKQEKIDKSKQSTEERKIQTFSPKLIGDIADEVSKSIIMHLPTLLKRPRTKKKPKKTKRIEYALLLDTSAIIDGRIFDVINTGLLNGVVVLPPGILLELKHLADSQDTVKRVRGRKGLEALEKLKKNKKLKVLVLPEEEKKPGQKGIEVDEQLIKAAKYHKGKVITCDYNLEKKAAIEGVVAINVNALANCLKVIAVPGDSLYVQVSHQGKDPTQGVGYLDDGTMLVVEDGSNFIGESIDVVVARVIQTATGRILFAKKI